VIEADGLVRPPRHNNRTYQRRRRRILAGSPRCAFGCGRPATTVDHIIPLSRGGTHDLDNLRPACWPCNAGSGSEGRPRGGLYRPRPGAA
jgi:5-methylcytosine-specific restriction endonuclease McrA